MTERTIYITSNYSENILLTAFRLFPFHSSIFYFIRGRLNEWTKEQTKTSRFWLKNKKQTVILCENEANKSILFFTKDTFFENILDQTVILKAGQFFLCMEWNTRERIHYSIYWFMNVKNMHRSLYELNFISFFFVCFLNSPLILKFAFSTKQEKKNPIFMWVNFL